jgi:hypothetical protein
MSAAMGKRAKKPGSLLDQYRLLSFVVMAPWATLLDVRVAAAVIEAYWPSLGYSSQSERQIAAAIGVKRCRTHIRASIRKLIHHDILRVVRAGTLHRAAEYGVNFEGAEIVSSSEKIEGTEIVPSEGTEIVSSKEVLRGLNQSPTPAYLPALAGQVGERERERWRYRARPGDGAFGRVAPGIRSRMAETVAR